MRPHGDFHRIYDAAVRHSHAGRFAESIALFERALKFKPLHAEAHNNLGSALAMLGRIDDAMAHYERALALKPNSAGIYNNLAIMRMRQERLQDAKALYERALAIDPDHAEARNNLGNILKEGGQFDDAMTHFNRAIAVRPNYAEAHYNRAEIRTFRRGDEYLDALEALAQGKELPIDKALYIHFALAKALDDSGDYERAFEHLRKGNALKRRRLNYNAARELQTIRRIAELSDRHLFDRLRGKGDPSVVPIFVLGMPRSGSTLIEQILASHPRIQAAGELRSFESAAAAMSGGNGRAIPWPEYLPDLDEAALRRIGESYIASLPAAAKGRVRIIDKMPGNFSRIGLIRLVFPNARIIHTTRHPVDTCMSCFSKLFDFGHSYCYDLAELGRYYRAYRELMNHWRSVLPPDAILDVAYENIVYDLEDQARRLIEYCGLPWDERCINFHETARSVRTASAVQVRKPLFRTSVQRWRRYATGLAPLLNELGDIVTGDTQTRAARA
jgi:tetratricopeptide (TPR) repeat protein